MKKNILFVAAGLLTGLLVAVVFIFTTAESIMLSEKQSKYSFERSVELFEETALANGWKIPAVHDMQKTMQNFGKDVLQAKVFELCHPVHAYEILSRDKEKIVLSMLPCRVAIYEKSDGKTYVSYMNTGLMGKMMSGVIPKVMKEASHESEMIIAPLIK
jgi:uncharacterized protein (DUF302 family)